MTSESEEQFRDFLFIHRLQVDRNVRHSQTAFTQPKIPHTRWTRKVIRQKQNQQKMQTLHIFNKEPIKQEKRTAKKVDIVNIWDKESRNTFSHHLVNNHKEKKQGSYVRFAINQLALSGSQLHSEEVDCDEPQTLKPSRKTHETLPLQPSKIKTKVSLYKGNFAKFTRKKGIQSFKIKKSKHQSELSPWDHENRSQLFM